ncbi:hypothetical protein [Clostridium botulinum]|nr:hypothetical protein [Clostridium botulinum]
MCIYLFLDEYGKKAYLKVYDLCKNDSLAAYISDDFGVIRDSELIGYADN